MEQAIGTKRIEFMPMTRGEYNEYRGWETPQDEDPSDEGYLVEYPDSDNQNHPAHRHYVSWSPKKEFDNAYNTLDQMSFGHAIELLKAGRRVARAGWNGKSMFLFLVPGSNFEVNRPPLLGIYPEGTPIDYHAHIDMKTVGGDVVPWVASQTDMLATDWQVVG